MQTRARATSRRLCGVVLGVATVVALIGAAAAAAAPSAEAVGLPAVFFGRANPGDEVMARIDATACATTTAGEAYGWALLPHPRDCEGKAAPGATVTFSVNGYRSLHAETWAYGGVADDLEHAIAPGRYVAACAGRSHVCALTADGELVCRGQGGYGQVAAPHGRYSALSSGGHTNCALAIDGSAACRGHNADPPSRPRPLKEGTGGPYPAVTAGQSAWCVLTDAGAVRRRSSLNRAGEFVFPGPYVDMSAGSFHLCARSEQGFLSWLGRHCLAVGGPRGAVLDGGRGVTARLRAER